MDPVIGVLLLAAIELGWVAICAAANAWQRPAVPAKTDPCAEFRARSSARRAEGAQLPGGTR